MESKECLDSKTILCETMMVDTSHCAFVQTHRAYNPRVSPNANCGHWVIVMDPYVVIRSNKWATPVGGVDSGAGEAVCL